MKQAGETGDNTDKLEVKPRALGQLQEVGCFSRLCPSVEMHSEVNLHPWAFPF